MKCRNKIGSIILMSILVLTQIFVCMPDTVIINAEIAENAEDTKTETENVESLSTPSPDVEEQDAESEQQEATPTPVVENEPTVSPEPIQPQETTSPEAESDTADIRMVFTTDLHGQLTTMNYETGATEKVGSLARAATLISQARAEKDSQNTFLFDLGDVLYDYSTDYIYDQDETKLQPIYKAMTTLGYDAITLGNHDFDYTLSYIKQQMQLSGLEKICVVSNMKTVNTGSSVWNENMILNRMVKTNSGKEMTIKIGVIGETIPYLYPKRSDYTNVLKGEDIIENATKQAAELKKQGADVVVELAHSGRN